MTGLADWKIVLIDDEEDIRDVLTMALEDAGYEVQSAPDGPTGIRLCEALSPQIVVTDIRMPGMDGILGCDERDVVITYNHSMQQLVGYDKQEVINRMSLAQFCAPGEAARWTFCKSPSKTGR